MIASGEPPDLELGGGTPVERRETHISWVVLAGDRAYKIKKPVVLPFVDYGTAARRRAMCHAEVDLNRRLAPDVYLGVRSLVPGPHGRLRLGAESDRAAVDYAVEMRRYEEDATLAARLATGTVGVGALRAVGARLARFHADAAVHPCKHGAEAVKRELDDNFATLRSLASDRDDRAAIARAERFVSAFLTAVWDELDRRAASGRVRDGHGDLRLEHVLLERDVEIVDCVEFAPGLRRIDVAADLAFLVMELHERRRPELAAALVAAYRAAGSNPGSDALLGFFASYRAHVRAKVAMLRAGQLPEAEAAPHRRHATALLSLGARLQWAARAPVILVVAGLSATGKSTLAAALAAESGYPCVNSDVVRKQRAGLPPTEPGPHRIYGSEASLATYAALGRRARILAESGVIVDATFRRRADRDAFRRETRPEAPTLVVECQAPQAVLEARARARGRDPGAVSDAGVSVVRRQREDADPLDEVPPQIHLRVRSERLALELVAEIADAVDRRLVAPPGAVNRRLPPRRPRPRDAGREIAR